MNTGFYGIFDEKLKKMKKELKVELERAKTDRRRDWIKKQIKEAKSLRNLLREMDKVMGKQTRCPHCGGEL